MMKTTIAILFALIGLGVGSAFAQNKATVMMDATGNVVSPSNFLSSNVLNRAGIIRAVNGSSDLFGAAPLRSGEHVFVIDAGTFGNGGAAMFTHDPGSSNPTNTTDTITASPGRWIVRRVYSAPPALPLTAGSNSPLAGDLYLSAFVMNGVRYTNVTSSPGGSSVLSNAVLLGTTSFQDGIITNLTVINASLSNVSLTVPKLGTATAQSITTTNSFQLLALTASRGVLTDASKNLISDEAATGTGAPVRASNAVLVGKPEVPLQSTNEANTNTIPSLGWVKRHVADRIAEIPAGSGGFAVNASGTHTNATNTSTVAVSGDGAGNAQWSTVLPQTLIITNATNFNWTFPVGARLFRVGAIGGGGAGGSARKGPTNTVCAAGSGGGAGAYSFGVVTIEQLGGATTIAITNGAGGIGGPSQTTNSTHGIVGGNGGATSFGNWIIASGGTGGSGGTAGAGVAGAGGSAFALTLGGGGGAASGTGAGGANGVDMNGGSYFQHMIQPSGGASGGGITSSGVASVGGRGGVSSGWSVGARGGQGYGSPGAINGNGGDGSASAHNAFFTGGGGGGGGGSSVTGNGGNGGKGGKYGAGGGGGGAAGDGIGNSGAGGDGYQGVMIIVVE